MIHDFTRNWRILVLTHCNIFAFPPEIHEFTALPAECALIKLLDFFVVVVNLVSKKL